MGGGGGEEPVDLVRFEERALTSLHHGALLIVEEVRPNKRLPPGPRQDETEESERVVKGLS
jgi:hypothetical protein